ncbi:MAG: hypothetical protein H6602_11550 [Flavobacteriales bacterium]|nr:hypothetical protein [Flavobacteriales bacterium]
MEILIAVLIAFGVVTGNDAVNMSKSEAEKIATESGLSQKQIDDKAAIIGLEETEM